MAAIVTATFPVAEGLVGTITPGSLTVTSASAGWESIAGITPESVAMAVRPVTVGTTVTMSIRPITMTVPFGPVAVTVLGMITVSVSRPVAVSSTVRPISVAEISTVIPMAMAVTVAGEAAVATMAEVAVSASSSPTTANIALGVFFGFGIGIAAISFLALGSVLGMSAGIPGVAVLLAHRLRTSLVTTTAIMSTVFGLGGFGHGGNLALVGLRCHGCR